ncbi:uncharacterized protein LOC131333015 [Rhododendron vialii]|uniref:uncharacterized protein LOC131333015 n=1 Tax=Rhododendron vialii TaxID=182163 RepID=UPI00265E7B8B|nr:uncharacterized protein LOC131333015 [Rhododendron vialii]
MSNGKVVPSYHFIEGKKRERSHGFEFIVRDAHMPKTHKLTCWGINCIPKIKFIEHHFRYDFETHLEQIILLADLFHLISLDLSSSLSLCLAAFVRLYRKDGMSKHLDFNRDKDIARDFRPNFADANGEPKYMKTPVSCYLPQLRALTWSFAAPLMLEWETHPTINGGEARSSVKCSHKYLKVVEMAGYYGGTSDFELAMYFIEIVVALDKVVIDPRCQYSHSIRSPESTKCEELAGRSRAYWQFQGKVPMGVELVLL